MSALDQDLRETHVFPDTHNGSRKAPGAEHVAPVNRTDGALRRAAQLRRDIDEAQLLLVRLCERIDESRAECDAVGVATENRLSPEFGAAYGAFLSNRDTPKRIELTQLPEAPLPPEGD